MDLHTDIHHLKLSLNQLISILFQIRTLSAVSTVNVENAEDYSRKLREDFKKIGEIGIESRHILENELYPLIRTDQILDESILNVLQTFCHSLLEPISGEELDLTILYEVSDKLLHDYQSVYLYTGEADHLIEQVRIHVNVCYANVNRTARITTDKGISTFFRDQGLKAAEIAKNFVYNRKKFMTLSNDAKKDALITVRFYSALYDTSYATKEGNIARYHALTEAISLCDESFYHENISDYDWDVHCYRCIEHMGQLTEHGNHWGFSADTCREICGYLDKLTVFRQTHPVEAEKILPASQYELEIIRNQYFAGYISDSCYRDNLLQLYKKYSGQQYDMHDVQINLLIPAEYMASLRENMDIHALPERILSVLHMFYVNAVDYVFGSMNQDAFNFLQEYLCAFLEEFIEIPAVSFEKIGLACMTAIHAPTYVHSQQVADLCVCLARHLPVSREQLHFLYHAALCHDFGKLTMADSIFIYGRKLSDLEFQMIRNHTKMGWYMLRNYPSTKEYQDIALSHHVFYDGSKGYTIPEVFSISLLKDIVVAADCIDAATDSIGRSYNKGKNLQQIIEELKEGSSTRYNPDVVSIIQKHNVQKELQEILTKGREKKYEMTYKLLTEIKHSKHFLNSVL